MRVREELRCEAAIGIGASPVDAEFLSRAELPLIIPAPTASRRGVIARVPHARIAPAPAPDGWSAAVAMRANCRPSIGSQSRDVVEAREFQRGETLPDLAASKSCHDDEAGTDPSRIRCDPGRRRVFRTNAMRDGAGRIIGASAYARAARRESRDHRRRAFMLDCRADGHRATRHLLLCRRDRSPARRAENRRCTADRRCTAGHDHRDTRTSRIASAVPYRSSEASVADTNRLAVFAGNGDVINSDDRRHDRRQFPLESHRHRGADLTSPTGGDPPDSTAALTCGALPPSRTRKGDFICATMMAVAAILRRYGCGPKTETQRPPLRRIRPPRGGRDERRTGSGRAGTVVGKPATVFLHHRSGSDGDIGAPMKFGHCEAGRMPARVCRGRSNESVSFQMGDGTMLYDAMASASGNEQLSGCRRQSGTGAGNGPRPAVKGTPSFLGGVYSAAISRRRNRRRSSAKKVVARM